MKGPTPPHHVLLGCLLWALTVPVSQQLQMPGKVPASARSCTDPSLLWLAWLQNLDRGLQRALNRQEFDVAQDIRTRREQVDKVLAAHLVRLQAGTNAAIFQWQSAVMLTGRQTLPA